MFNNLSDRLTSTFKKLSGNNKLSEKNVAEALTEVKRALIEADVALEVITPFIDKVKNQAIGADVINQLKPGEVFKKIIHDGLVDILSQGSNAALNLASKPPAVILMCGLQGAGKTTTCAKLAYWLQQQKKTVLMVSTDVNRPGAIEQLNILGQQLNIDCCEASTSDTPLQIAERALKTAKKNLTDVLIVDTAGRLHIDQSLMTEVSQLHTLLKPTETIFVMDSMTGQDAAHSAKAFSNQLPLTGTILTKIDGDSRGGAALSARVITNTPIKFIGDSEHIKSGLKPLDAQRLADQILDMGDVVGLVETLEKHVDEAAAKKLEKKLRKGQFDMNDFVQQIQQMQKMGGMSGLMSKMPGAKQYADQIAQAKPDQQLKYTLAIIQSMTRQEKHQPDLISGRRKRRIANGSGTDIPTVNRTLKQFKQMQKMMKKAKGGNLQKMMSKFMPPGAM